MAGLIKGQGAGSLAKEWYTALGIEELIDGQEGVPDADKQTAKDDALAKFQKLSDTLIDHIRLNMVVKEVHCNLDSPATAGSVTAPAVLGAADPVTHVVTAAITNPATAGNVTNVQSTQNDDGTGHVE
jgi:hypothetical protein